MEDTQIAIVRGVRNCGAHHEENATSPAIMFSNECDRCATKLFAVIYNAGVDAMVREAVRQVTRR